MYSAPMHSGRVEEDREVRNAVQCIGVAGCWPTTRAGMLAEPLALLLLLTA